MGAQTDKGREARSVPVRSCTQSPSPSPCLPSSSLGFVFPRVSDAPFGGRRDGPTSSRSASAASSPPLATDPGRELSPGSEGRPEPPTRAGPLRPGGADSGPVCAAQLRPAAPPPARGLTTHPRSGRLGSRSAACPGGREPSRSHAPTCAARSEGSARPGRSPAARRVCPCAAAAAAAGWLAHWLPARLTPRWGFLWGWTKDISWEEQGNVPSMPRFVVPGDFLPPRPDGDSARGQRRSPLPAALGGREPRGRLALHPAPRPVRPGGAPVHASQTAPAAEAAVPDPGDCSRAPAVYAGGPCGGSGLFFGKEEVSGGFALS